MMCEVSHQSWADQNRCGSASALDKIFTPLIFSGPLNQNYLSPHFLLICIFTCSDLCLGSWVASEPDTSTAWEQLAHLESPQMCHITLSAQEWWGGGECPRHISILAKSIRST